MATSTQEPVLPPNPAQRVQILAGQEVASLTVGSQHTPIDVCGSGPRLEWIREPLDLLEALTAAQLRFSLSRSEAMAGEATAPPAATDPSRDEPVVIPPVALALTAVVIVTVVGVLRTLVGRLRERRRTGRVAEANALASKAHACAEGAPSIQTDDSGKGPRVIPIRRLSGGVPVELPPHVAAVMARAQERRQRAQAHATYVRAERGPGLSATGTEDSGATPRETPLGPDPGKSWIVGD